MEADYYLGLDQFEDSASADEKASLELISSIVAKSQAEFYQRNELEKPIDLDYFSERLRNEIDRIENLGRVANFPFPSVLLNREFGTRRPSSPYIFKNNNLYRLPPNLVRPTLPKILDPRSHVQPWF